MHRSWAAHGLLLSIISALLLGGCGDGGSPASGGTAGSAGTAATGGAAGEAGSAGTAGMGGSAGSGGMEVQLGDISFTVAYAGAKTGTLSVAGFPSFPPAGPPVAYQSYSTPAFPQTGKLTGLEVGKPVYVVTVLDVGNNNPQSPGPEDLSAVTMPPIDIVAGSEVMTTLTLMDK
jgi:hypothetical protein